MSMNSVVVIPEPTVARKRVGWWIVPVLLAVAVAVAAITWRPWERGGADVVTGQFYSVIPMDLDIRIVKDGELASIRYTDVENEVEGSTQIIWLVKEGTTVEKGDELVRLDASDLTLRKESLDLDLQKAESNLKIAEETKAIQEMQNTANKEATEVAVRLAHLDLKQYKDGTFPQQLETAETALKMAETNLKNKQEDLAQTRALYAKGFVTAADVKKGELDVMTAENEKRRAERALRVLNEYAYPMQFTSLESAVAQAEQRLARTLRSNRSMLTQVEADLAEKQKSLKYLTERAEKLAQQIEACTIRAPEAGLVIYMSSIDRHGREPVQEGVSVRQGQTLMRLPDVRAMKAVLKISEAQKPRLDGKDNIRASVKILGVDRPIGATLSKVAVLPDNSQRWWNPDLKEYPIELTLDETPPGVKPGTRIDAEILLDRHAGVLAVPLSAVYSAGSAAYVFVREGETVRERQVTLGASNETYVQVVTGVNEGEQVLQLQVGQGRLLLEKAGIKLDEAATRSTARADRPERPAERNDRAERAEPTSRRDQPQATRG